MRYAKITRVDQTPDWEKVEVLSIDNQVWSVPVDIIPQAQIAYNDDSIFVRLKAREQNIRNEESGPIGMPCKDSCLEFFFCPEPDSNRYFNIEFNPGCCMFLGIGTGKHDLVRLLPMNDVFSPESSVGDGEWEICYTIPVRFIRSFFPRFRPERGGLMRANFYKCGDLTDQVHYFSWSPMSPEVKGFHDPSKFGMLEFE